MKLIINRFPKANFKWIAEGFSFFLGFMALNYLDWPQLRFWRVKGPGGRFEDLQGILELGDCYQNIGIEVFKYEGNCTGYMYGKFLLDTFNFLHIREHHSYSIGIGLLLLLSLALSFLFRSVNFKFSYILKAAIVFSPPILLLAERGNFDTVIFLLILASSLLLIINLPEIAILPLISASLMKFYTLPSLVALLILKFGIRMKVILVTTSAVAGYLILQDLGRVQAGFRQLWYAQFGMSVWGRYANEVQLFQLNETTINLIGIFIFGLTILLISRSPRIPKHILLSDQSFYQTRNITFFLLFSTHLACFTLGMSYDYRLIFIIGASGALLSSGCNLSVHQVRKIIIFLTCMVWCSYNSGQLQIIGNVMLEFLTAWYLIVTYNHLKSFVRKSD